MPESLVIADRGGRLRTLNDGRTIDYLNADLLDGKHAAAFALVEHTHGNPFDQKLNTYNDVIFNSLLLDNPYNPFDQDLNTYNEVTFE